MAGVRSHAPQTANGELSVGEGMILSSESRMREIRMSGSMSGREQLPPIRLPLPRELPILHQSG